MKTRTLCAVFLLTITSVLFAQQPKAGANKDEHGCMASAGYTYSQLKKECIRTFEQKIQMKEIATKGNYTAAVLFNKEQTKAEIFLKEEKTSVILSSSTKSIWKNATYTLTKDKGFVLVRNKKPIYKS